eukprot:CCRYP_005412-RA/>CCRYP_005412-RA protein AED:0.35 eAED:0.35 QI:0/0/0/1/0/0/3/0/568
MKKADLRAIVKDNCTHLSVPEQTKLLELLQEFEELFSGKLGDWDCKPVSLQLKEGAQPYHGRPFPIPKKHVEITKRKIQRLCDLGVLKWQDDSEWALPTFIIPKKENTVWVVSDFREVNKHIVRKPFPIPKISTVLQELEGFTFATALDLNMGYYTMRLDPDASKICTITFPWGKYSYLWLPMGVACSPDIFQAKMSELMATLEFVRTYLDDLLCISKGSLEDHLNKPRRYVPTTVYIKGIHNTVAYAISRLDYGPIADDRSTWMTSAQCWCYHNTAQPKSSLATTEESMNQMFANRNEEDSIYPLTTREIAEAQQDDTSLLNKGYSTHLVENIKVLCKDGKMVIQKSLQHRAVVWFHHYLQHPGTKRLKETLRLSMYWKGLRTTVQSHVNKRRQIKYGKLPTKLAITNPWEALCVDLIGPYTLMGKDKTQIDFMCITMIDPAISWFEIVELPVSQLQELDIPTGTKGQRSKDTHVETKQPYFDKTSVTVGNIVNRTWFSRYPRSQDIIYDNGSEFKLHFETLCDSYGLKRKPTSVRNPHANAILERVHQTIMAMLLTADLDMADTNS